MLEGSSLKIETKQKKIIAAAIAVLVVVAAIFLFYTLRKIKEFGTENVTVNPASQTMKETVQKNMLNAVNEANKEDEQTPPKEQAKKQDEMQKAVEAANKPTAPVSQDEQNKQAQDMLNAVNALNSK